MAFPAAPPPLDGVVHADVDIDRVRWHVATAGDAAAAPILLLHGWPQHWWMWRDVIPDLASTHRVLAPDLRGFGWSEAPPGRYSKMGLARDVEHLLDALDVDRCMVVGHDWGALVGFLLAIRAPERVERLVALSNIHPWFRPGPTELPALVTGAYTVVLATPVVGELVQRSGARILGPLVRRAVAPGFAWDPEDLALFVDAWDRPEHARAASALYRTFLTRELPAIVAGRYANRRLEMPILHATGAHDPVITPARIAGGAEHAPAMRKAVIADAGHFVADERPERVVALVRSELDRAL